MRISRFIFVVVLLVCLGLCNAFAQKNNVWNPDNGNGTFTNPIFWGDWPDPDIIRVDDKFYLLYL